MSHVPVGELTSALATAPRTVGDDGLEWNRTGVGFSVVVHREQRYQMIVERGLLAKVGRFLRPLADQMDADSLVIVTDENVAEHHAQTLVQSANEVALRCEVLVISPGERSKSIDEARRLWDAFVALGVRRRTPILALGGGVVCDLVGFVASTFMRGVPYVNVPTSLMAQLDAAIGGKVAVDHPSTKNLIGAFHHPVSVLVDPDTVLTLDRPEVSNGLAEAIKVAVIASPKLFDLLERLPADSNESMDDIVIECIATKLRLLEQDPFERCLRRLLNFGHCIAHALEASSSYTIFRHGEAVGIGISIASELARQRGLCTQDTRDRIIHQVERVGLSPAMPPAYGQDVWGRLSMIRRVRNGNLNFVVPCAIGRCEILDGIDRGEYESAVAALQPT